MIIIVGSSSTLSQMSPRRVRFILKLDMKAFNAGHSVTWKLSNQWVANIYYMHVRNIVSKLLAYHWRELPQVSFLSWHTFCRKKHVSFVSTNPSFVMTKVSLSSQNFCHAKNILSQQKFCLYKHNFVTTNNFVMTKVLSQAYFSHDKRLVCHDKHFYCNKIMFVMTKDVFCHNKLAFWFVATKLLSWQKVYLWQLLPMLLASQVYSLSE